MLKVVSCNFNLSRFLPIQSINQSLMATWFYRGIFPSPPAIGFSSSQAKDLGDGSISTLEKVEATSISLKKLVSLAHFVGAEVLGFHTNESTIDDFHNYVLKCSTSDDCHMIASYHRAAFKQTGVVHYSPIGGYHVGRDMALILDVERYKYPPHWVPFKLLWEAMEHVIEATDQHREFMLISRSDRKTRAPSTTEIKVEDHNLTLEQKGPQFDLRSFSKY